MSILFNCNWKRDHVLLYTLPREGKECQDHTLGLATAIVTHHIEFTSLEHLDKSRSELQVLASVSKKND
jgi:hypothetical protein